MQLDLNQLCSHFEQNLNHYSLELLDQTLQKLNESHKLRAMNYLNNALNNLRGQLRYRFLELNRQVSDSYSLIEPYFTVLSNGKVAANNGWILDHDPAENFITSDNFNYLQRTVVIWSDLIKLRFGDRKQDSPFLWKYMRKYVKLMA